MIVGPTSYFGVEPINQIDGGHAQRSFDVSADTIQKGLDILFGRLDEQFPVRILAHILPEEIKAFLHMCDDRLQGESSRPRSCRNCSTRGLISPSSSSVVLPVMMKSRVKEWLSDFRERLAVSADFPIAVPH